ncbi:hypothetical protein CRENBAI_026026 [Crenichthys baileyi]|uniref:Uncharacterized protein n=1 Tax=Crenichthys baileyi TaxID=28760 RepID=A0AAV9RZC1_9TELE
MDQPRRSQREFKERRGDRQDLLTYDNIEKESQKDLEEITASMWRLPVPSSTSLSTKGSAGASAPASTEGQLDIPGPVLEGSVDEPPSHRVPAREGFWDGLPSLPVPVPEEFEDELPLLPVPVLKGFEDEPPPILPVPEEFKDELPPLPVPAPEEFGDELLPLLIPVPEGFEDKPPLLPVPEGFGDELPPVQVPEFCEGCENEPLC